MEWLVGIAGLWLFFQFVLPIVLVGLAVYVAYRYMKSHWPEGRAVPYEAPPEGLETPAATFTPVSPEEDRLVTGEPTTGRAPSAGSEVHVLRPHAEHPEAHVFKAPEEHPEVHVFKAHEEHPDVHIVQPHEAHPEAHIIREDERR